MKNKFSFIIRCGTPDCEWRFAMPDLGNVAVEACYSTFQQHCVEDHGLTEDSEDACMYLDLEKWTLTFVEVSLRASSPS